MLDQAAPVTYHLSGRKVRADTSGAVRSSGTGTEPVRWPPHATQAASRSTTDVAMQALPCDRHVPGADFIRGAVFGHAVVPGLAPARGAERSDAQGQSPLRADGQFGEKRFKGRCFVCGKKGHSKTHCPARGLTEPC